MMMMMNRGRLPAPARVLGRVRCLLQAVGALTLLALAGAGIDAWRSEVPPSRGSPREPIPVSPVAERIAAKLAPSLQTLAVENKSAVVAASGGSITRLAVRTIYPAGVEAIPHATRIGCDRALSYLDGLSVAELVEMMTEHARAKGEAVHPTVARQAGVQPSR